MAHLVERLLFPESRLRQFIAVTMLACAFSFALTGRQITQANWGLIDDNEVFTYLGSDLRLPFNEIWQTLATKTEVGQLQGRFRPSYYVFKVTEASLFGTNVHLWYLVNTACFAILLASVWWGLVRFLGLWLSGAITAAIALLPMWADVWSRLGPSEIFGAGCLGLMLFATTATLFSERQSARYFGAAALILLSIVFAGFKETFLPVAVGLPLFVFGFGIINRRLSPLISAALCLPLAACILTIGIVVLKQVHTAGADFYGRAAGPIITIGYTALGLIDGIARTWWLWILPVAVLQLLEIIPSRAWKERFLSSMPAFSVYLFLIAMYAAQCGLYRMLFPHNNRYDFPAMLIIPLSSCVLVAEITSKLRLRHSKATMDRALCAAGFFVIFFLVTNHLGQPPALAISVKRNIDTTKTFFAEVQRMAQVAKENPDAPIIIEAGGPLAYEGAYTLPRFLTAFGVRNTFSVRYHQDQRPLDALSEGLGRTIKSWETTRTDTFTPLAEAWEKRAGGCLSVGVYTNPDQLCVGFRISNGLDPAAQRSSP